MAYSDIIGSEYVVWFAGCIVGHRALALVIVGHIGITGSGDGMETAAAFVDGGGLGWVADPGECAGAEGDKKRFSRDSSSYVAKMPLKDMENPQDYVNVSSELMKDQLITVYSDALKNVPGVVMQLENNSAGGTVTSRGFSTQSWLQNGVPGLVGGRTIDPSNLERIEAIKGPSGALYGS